MFQSQKYLATSHAKAFSLVELLITVSIIGILVVVAMPSYKQYKIRAKYPLRQVTGQLDEIRLKIVDCIGKNQFKVIGDPTYHKGLDMDNSGVILGSDVGLMALYPRNCPLDAVDTHILENLADGWSVLMGRTRFDDSGQLNSYDELGKACDLNDDTIVDGRDYLMVHSWVYYYKEEFCPSE